MAEFTKKGDWQIIKVGLTSQIISGDYTVAERIYNEANARLIAAAPDIYEALGTIKRTAESGGNDISYLQNALKTIARIAREAKAKAEGK